MEAWHVARTMRALELLAYTPASAPQVADALGAHPRTVRRLLEQLAAEEYVVRGDDHRRRYRPTMRLVALAGQVLNNSELVQRARPYVALAQERTDAVAELVMPSYQSVVCVLHATMDGELAGPAVQHVVPAHRSAGGKVLLAWRDHWRDSVLAAPSQPRTDGPISDPQLLRHQLEAVRTEGYAIETDQGEAGGRSVAAPIVTDGQTVAALQVCNIQDRDSAREYIARLVIRTARELSHDLAVRRP
jgi:DNA-binding IclR family transcriptional regulator